MLPKVLEIFWGVKRDPCICLGETHSAPPPLCFAPSHALALLQAIIAAWQICSSHGWSKPTHKPDPSGSQKRNIKVNPGGVGGCTHPFGSQTFGEILKWIFYKKRGNFLWYENMVETTTQLKMDQPFYLATSWFQILHKNWWQTKG